MVCMARASSTSSRMFLRSLPNVDSVALVVSLKEIIIIRCSNCCIYLSCVVDYHESVRSFVYRNS